MRSMAALADRDVTFSAGDGGWPEPPVRSAAEVGLGDKLRAAPLLVRTRGGPPFPALACTVVGLICLLEEAPLVPGARAGGVTRPSISMLEMPPPVNAEDSRLLVGDP